MLNPAAKLQKKRETAEDVTAAESSAVWDGRFNDFSVRLRGYLCPYLPTKYAAGVRP